MCRNFINITQIFCALDIYRIMLEIRSLWTSVMERPGGTVKRSGTASGAGTPICEVLTGGMLHVEELSVLLGARDGLWKEPGGHLRFWDKRTQTDQYKKF